MKEIKEIKTTNPNKMRSFKYGKYRIDIMNESAYIIDETEDNIISFIDGENFLNANSDLEVWVKQVLEMNNLLDNLDERK